MPPRLLAVEPLQAAAGATVTLKGTAFGAEQDESAITLNGRASTLRAVTWNDDKITFAIPPGMAAGVVRVGIRIYGQNVPGEVALTVTA